MVKNHYPANFQNLPKLCNTFNNLITLSASGMLMADSSKIEDLSQLLRLWHHENCRVFQDRLVNNQDREWFSGYLEEKITKDFGCKMDEVNPRQPMLYGDFMIANVDNKVYAEVTDQEKVM